MTQPLVVIGAGGMGRCVLDIVDAVNDAGDGPTFEVVGIVDDAPARPDLLDSRGVDYLGPVAVVDDLPLEVGYVIGIASTAAKQRLDERWAASGRTSPVLVHPNVHRGFDVRLGPGTVVASHVSMENHIRVGRHVHVNQNSTVGHDAVLGDYVTVSPLVAVSGDVHLQERAFIGTGATVNQGLTVATGATVGAGAAVVRGVAEETTVVGVPARPINHDR